MVGTEYNLENKGHRVQCLLLPALLLGILDCMDQDWLEMAAEAANKPAYSPVPTVQSQWTQQDGQ